MNTILRQAPLACAALLSACGTTTVFDDWSCAAPTGSCSSVADVDAEAIGASSELLGGVPRPLEPAEDAAAPRASSAPLPANSAGARPSRTPDVVARIVFAPFTDKDGLFHDRAVLYAVMQDGEWRAPPPKTALDKDAKGAGNDD